MNAYHQLHPEVLDESYLAKQRALAAAQGRPLPEPMPSEAQIWENTREAMAEAESSQRTDDLSDNPIQRLRQEHEKREQEAAAQRVKEKAAQAMEIAAIAEMAFTFRNGTACRVWKAALVQLSTVLPPFDERIRAVIPGYRQNALHELVLAVQQMPGSDAFTDERLAKEAEGFAARFEKPVDGAGGSIPHHLGGTVADGRRLPAATEALSLWADRAQKAEIDVQRQRPEEAARQRELNIGRETGYGALGFDRGF